MEAAIFLTGKACGRELTLHAVRMGDDLCVALSGGDQAHLGAAAVAVPRESLTGDGSVSATVSVIALTGHKEDELARSLARRIAVSRGCCVTVCAGIHVENASPEDISSILACADGLADELLHRLAAQ